MKSKTAGRLLTFFFALALSVVAYAQNATVRGVVKDLSGQPIPGVNVIVAGTTSGTITDFDGNYQLSAPSDANLTFSFIGYVSQTIAVAGQTTINVTLEEEAHDLNEVVVVGYGQMKRSDVTGSVVSVSDEAIKQSVPTSVDQVLQGRAAGVQIQANSGTPGGNSSIRIRGTNSINLTSQPIFVIDGVVIETATSDDSSNPLASINPNDIVSMDVLKDASATAIYGARAANGVIMITTKRGKTGEALISYDGYVGWQEMPKHLDVLNLNEYAEHYNAIAEAGIKNASANFVRPDLLSEGTDWQDELFRQAFTTSHNISLSGGKEGISYAFSGGYLEQEGIALGSSFERLTMRSNIDAELKPWLKGGVNFSMTLSEQQLGTDNNLIMNALRSQPSTAVYNADGGFDGPDDTWMPENPVAIALLRDNYNEKDNFRVNSYLDITLYKGLTFKSEVSGDFNNQRYYYYEPDYKLGIKENKTRTGKWTKTNSQYWSWRNILTYNETFAEKHNLNVMLGQEMSHNHWETQASTATGFLSNSATDPSAGDITQSTGTGSQVNSSIYSFFGRLFYSFDDRYLLTATLRRDGSSKFAEDNRWGWFPSAALAWKISNESFLKDNPIMNNLKLRLGWGTTGNQNVENWAYMALLSSKTTPWGTGVLNGNTANPNLKWETTYSTNVGLDICFFQNRIEFIADWYMKSTEDLLLQLPLPAFIGSSGQGSASNPWGNVGEISNTGLEFTLNTVNVNRAGFMWQSNVVFSLNRNEVEALDTEGAEIAYNLAIGSDNTNVTKTVVGKPIGQFYGYKVIGMFNKPEDFFYKDKDGVIREVARPEGVGIGENEAWLGDFIFEDVDGNGTIGNEDQQFIGNPEPKFTWGFGNTFSYKGFDLNIFFTGSYGNDVVNYNRRWTEITGSTSNLSKAVLDYARVEKIDPDGPDDYRNFRVTNAGTKMPRLYTESSKNNNHRMSDNYVEDGSYIRLQNVSLAYTFPKNWVSKIKLQNVKLYCNLQNVYTWTEYKGYDPEVGSLYGNTLLNGVDYGRYPSPRIMTFGLNVAF